MQTEYSLWTRDVEAEVLPTLRELGIGLVAYSPLGRGFLTGQTTSPDDLAEDDWRRHNPRFQGENLQRNPGPGRGDPSHGQPRPTTRASRRRSWR